MNVHNSDADEVILIEKDVGVPMRDGARLKADVFRPKDGTLMPALLNLGCPGLYRKPNRPLICNFASENSLFRENNSLFR